MHLVQLKSIYLAKNIIARESETNRRPEILSSETVGRRSEQSQAVGPVWYWYMTHAYIEGER